ncbi:hypothetical protein O1611_g518 [Lasiodiplodia mahajangana]|uniref:Uncharacterized protein n=1 Tax=Lasiodiplodia mahajangana TaxID=1108764 RepID=A0ACC2K069_9PEZI|nr:hypothetical protein O1611_g518 [Lasiodiplodia mahajangana]
MQRNGTGERRQEGVAGASTGPQADWMVVRKELVRKPGGTGIEQAFLEFAPIPKGQSVPNPRPKTMRTELFPENQPLSDRWVNLMVAFQTFVAGPQSAQKAHVEELTAGVERLRERCERELAYLASPDFFSSRFQGNDHEDRNVETDGDDETVDDGADIEEDDETDAKVDDEVERKADGKTDGKRDNKMNKSDGETGDATVKEQVKKKKYQKRKPRVK